MGHKAGISFFDSKKEWSKRKDEILHYYLKPYLAKVSQLRKPILIVDGFAGPGVFHDGEPGSPTIISERIRESLQSQRAHPPPITAWFIEPNGELYTQLKDRMTPYKFARTYNSTFLSLVPQIEEAAANSTVFMYLDPFTVEGIEWQSLDRIFRLIAANHTSIEVLLNFNVHSFGRRAAALMKTDLFYAASESPADDPIHAAQVPHLNRIVGGSWWQKIMSSDLNYPSKLEEITAMFIRQLEQRFDEVLRHDVRDRWNDLIPKYILLFGSRHKDTRVLMNDAVCKSREMWANAHMEEQPSLFEMRPEGLVPEQSNIEPLVLSILAQKKLPISRQELVRLALEKHFGTYSSRELQCVIRNLIQKNKVALNSDTGRLNDNALLFIR